jgi:HPt (histidine-containing phosphotransfer) domain-containing protein
MGTLPLLSGAKASDFARLADTSCQKAADVAWFEDAAQEFVAGLRAAFPESVALARAYLTVPYGALPATNMNWVADLARAKGVFDEMTDQTPVISLVGSAGLKAAWNDRRASEGHVGIPMVSASFIDAIPMMSRLLASLGGDLAWIDSAAADKSFITSKLGTVAGTFHVPDAATQRDSKDRLVIPAVDFVKEHGIKTVFGIGGAFATGQLIVILVFCTEEISIETIQQMQTPFLHFKAAVSPLLRRVFREGRGASIAPVPVDMAAATTTTTTTAAAATAKKDDELACLNRAYLELEARLEERTNALKLILDSAGDAFLLVSFDGTIEGDITKTARSWFGDAEYAGRAAKGVEAASYLFRDDAPSATAFALGLEQIVDQMLPFELAADVMPKKLARAGRFYELSYGQVFERGSFVRVLVTVRDVTARIAAEEAERRSRELNAMIGLILRDRRGFEMYVEESRAAIDSVCAATEVRSILRALHTLKGNAAVCGLETFAALIHELEAEVIDSGEPLTPKMAEDLQTTWKQSLATISALIDLRPKNVLEVPISEHEEVVSRLEHGGDRKELASSMREWRLERAGIPLGRLAREAERLASRMGKQLNVIVDDGNVRLNPKSHAVAAFWSSLVHVVRNAVDHGIESPEDRMALGKTAIGELRLTAHRPAGPAVTDDNTVVITIADDGRGVDWDLVRSRTNEHDGSALKEVLFRDGFSTRDQADDISGRGIGLGAVRSACSTLGGSIDVESPLPGRGTLLRFCLPTQNITAAI